MAQKKNKEESAVQSEEQVQTKIHDETAPLAEVQEPVETATEKEVTGIPPKNETEEVEKPKDKPKTRKKEVIEEATGGENEELPEQALRVLELYPNEKSLYIGKHGGAYSISASQSVRGNAVLYKNPFYKSK